MKLIFVSLLSPLCPHPSAPTLFATTLSFPEPSWILTGSQKGQEQEGTEVYQSENGSRKDKEQKGLKRRVCDRIKVRINWGKTTRDSNILCFDFPQEMLCVVLALLKLVLTVFRYMLSNNTQRIGSVFLNLPSPNSPITCHFFTLYSCFYRCPGF